MFLFLILYIFFFLLKFVQQPCNPMQHTTQSFPLFNFFSAICLFNLSSSLHSIKNYLHKKVEDSSKYNKKLNSHLSSLHISMIQSRINTAHNTFLSHIHKDVHVSMERIVAYSMRIKIQQMLNSTQTQDFTFNN